jgi:hypothetical protein
MQVDYYTYKHQTFDCPECGWQGKGSELSNGDFSEVHFVCNLECPNCEHVIAFWQAPLINDAFQT